jgi:hypothetical protein
MIRPFTAVLGSAILLSSCAPQPLKEGAAPKLAAYRSGPLTIGVWGVGPIRQTTYFESPLIRELFPGAQVSDGTVRIAPDQTSAVITVVEDGVQMLEIDDGTSNTQGAADPTIGQVRAVGGPVLGPHGERLGLTWRDAGFDLSECEIGSDRDANTVFCARPGEGAVTYQFAVPGWDSEELPPTSAMRRGAYVKAIIWTPPSADGT